MTAKTRCSSRSGRRRGGWWPDGSLGVEDFAAQAFYGFFVFFELCKFKMI
jgi:hypothetical protein